jgi:hypothetical protein
LRDVRFTAPAERQLDEILGRSETEFGPVGRQRYEALVVLALAHDGMEDALAARIREGEPRD